METLGYIGLGNMGGPMAGNLIAAGNDVICYDAAGAKAHVPANAKMAGSVAEVARLARVIFLCLPDGKIVAEVADEIVAATDRAAEIVIDNTTAGIADAKHAHAVLAEAGISYADAPVSGGTRGAKAGTLAMMVAAPDALYDEVEPYLRAMASNARKVGDQPGQGMAMKLLNNFLSGMAMTATSEAVAFGVAQGLDMQAIIETVNVSTGRNTATEDKFPNRIANGAYDSGFATKLLAKDLRLYVESVHETGTAHSLSDHLRSIWDAMEKEMPASDFTEIYKFHGGG